MHVPEHFTPDQPAMTFSHNASSLHTSIQKHPVARKLPKATNHPSIQATEPEFRSLAARSDVPTTLEEMIKQSAPQLSLHITSFQDATLVGLAWSHTLMDAIGLESLLRAWSLVLAGREADVPPVLGAKEDVMWKIAGDVLRDQDDVAGEDDATLQSHTLQGCNKIIFFLRYAWDACRNRPPQRKLICLPQTTLAQLRQTVDDEEEEEQEKEETSKASPGSNDSKKAFVSDADILTAWLARLVGKSEPRPRPLTVASAVNARFRLARRLDPPPGVYCQNMVFVTFTFVPAAAAAGRGPLRPIAEAHRRHLAAQSTEARMLGLLRYLRRRRDGGQEAVAPLYGRPDSVPVTVNNLTKVEMLQAADFAPAVVGQGETTASGQRSSAVGAMTYWHLQPLKSRIWMRNHFVVLGKDNGGNCWILGTLTPNAWAVAEQELQKL